MTRAVRGSLLAAAVLLAACATQAPPPAVQAPAPNVFVLFPEPDGRTGQVTVTNAAGSQTLDQPRQATRVRSAQEAPEAPRALDDAEIQRLFGPTLGAEPPAPVRFLLHFRHGTDELTPDSAALLPEVVRAARARHPAEIAVTGHTDTTGDRAGNARLGLRRAETVAATLRSMGVDPASLETRSHGQDDPLVPTGPGVDEPRNRRVEITVR